MPIRRQAVEGGGATAEEVELARRNLIFSVLGAVGLGIIATFAMAASHGSDLTPTFANSCADGCRASYGRCYATSQNKASCQAQLDACLRQCLSAPRR